MNNSQITKYTNTIIKGDTIKILKQLPSNSVDVIFADPPYFMQTEGELLRTDGTKFAGVEDKWDKFKDYQEYDTFCEKWLTECKRILKPNGTIWVIGSFQNIYRLGYIMQNLGYWILNDIIWSKPNAVPNFGGTRFQNSHETMLWCSKDKNAKFTFNYKTMKHLNGDKQDKSVWDISICIGTERIKGKDGKKVHSTQKPEKLLYKVILSSSKPGDIILDPFFGTGTTGAVAKQLGRNFIGIEREKKYVEIATRRIDTVKEETNDITNLSLEVKPPKVPMKTLVQEGYLDIGQTLFAKDGTAIASILDTGHINDGEETLSIHKMCAKHFKKSTINGWKHLYKKENETLILIDTLRYQYIKDHKDENLSSSSPSEDTKVQGGNHES